MQNSEIGVAQVATAPEAVAPTGQNSLIRPGEADAEDLYIQELIIQASEVLHPQSDCLRDLIRSTSTGLRNNPLSMTVMGFLGLNVEVLAGIAAYCNIKFPENVKSLPMESIRSILLDSLINSSST